MSSSSSAAAASTSATFGINKRSYNDENNEDNDNPNPSKRLHTNVVKAYCCTNPLFGKCEERTMTTKEYNQQNQNRKCFLSIHNCQQNCTQPGEIIQKQLSYLNLKDQNSLAEVVGYHVKKFIIEKELDPVLQLLDKINNTSSDNLYPLLKYLVHEYLEKKIGQKHANKIFIKLLQLWITRSNEIESLSKYGIELLRKYKWISISSEKIQRKLWQDVLWYINIYSIGYMDDRLNKIITFVELKKWSSQEEFDQFIQPIFDKIFKLEENNEYPLETPHDENIIFGEADPYKYLKIFQILLVGWKNQVILLNSFLKLFMLQLFKTNPLTLLESVIDNPLFEKIWNKNKFIQEWYMRLENRLVGLFTKNEIDLLQKIYAVYEQKLNYNEFQKNNIPQMIIMYTELSNFIDEKCDAYWWRHAQYDNEFEMPYGKSEYITFRKVKFVSIDVYHLYFKLLYAVRCCETLRYLKRIAPSWLILPNESSSSSSSTAAAVTTTATNQ